MVRDGRAAAYSMMVKRRLQNKQKMSKQYLADWNTLNVIVNKQCKQVGPSYCQVVKYEDLIKKTKETLKSVVDFLNITWTDEFLNHEKYVGDKVVVSKTEWSTTQIEKKIYKDSLTSWVGQIEFESEKILEKNYNMLKEFGYV
jgi:hypothetical protein